MQGRQDIEALFHPGTVALYGFVKRDLPEGALVTSLTVRWGDAFALVDPEGGEVDGRKVYPSVAEIPGPVDLAVINIPREQVLEVAEECGRRGVRGLVVFSKGFGEIGGEGAELEARLIEVLRRYGMRMIGPNTNANSFDRQAEPVHPRIGKIGLVTQSGHLGRVLVEAAPYGLAFSRWIPTGNEADLEVADFIEYFAYDDETSAIALYLEGARDVSALRRSLAAASAGGKPVIALKVGRSETATRTAASHSAHLTGSDAVFDGLCRQYGVVRTHDLDEQIEVSGLYSKLREIAGNRVALYSISGASCSLMADLAEEYGLAVPTFTGETQQALGEHLPRWQPISNPVDVGNFHLSATRENRDRVLDVIAADLHIDAIVVAFTGVIATMTDAMAGDIARFVERSPKPVIVTWNSWNLGHSAYQTLIASGVPIFRTFRGCFRALAGLVEHSRRRELVRNRPPYAPRPRAAVHGTRVLDPLTAAGLLQSFGIPIAGERFVDSPGRAVEAAAELGFPVVMKLHLPGVTHKSDLGLVRVGLDTPERVVAVYAELAQRARELAPEGGALVQVQTQVPAGVEMIVGMTVDASLGPALLVGMGGIHAEVQRDVSVRPLPITPDDAREMVGELRGSGLLQSVRGQAAADVESLVELIVRVGRMAWERSDLVELDLNPVVVGSTGAVAVDSVIVVAE